jgi:hypothetical protein
MPRYEDEWVTQEFEAGKEPGGKPSWLSEIDARAEGPHPIRRIVVMASRARRVQATAPHA